MNYADKIQWLFRNGHIPKGAATHLTVRHDDDCPAINGGKECRCEPELWIGERRVDTLIPKGAG